MRPGRSPRQSARVQVKRHRWQGLQTLESRVLLSAIQIATTTVFPAKTNDTTPSISGTVDDVTAAVNITLTHTGGSAVGSFAAQTDGAGNWTFTLPDPDALADGHYDVVITASDNGGADTGELDLADALLVDSTSPLVTIDNGQLPAVVNHNVTLTGTYTDANIAGVVVTLDDGQGGTFNFNATLDTNAQTWSAPIAIGDLVVIPRPNGDGTYNTTVTATDLAGNSTPIAAGQLTVDTTAPTVALDSAQLPVMTNHGVTLTGTYNDANIAGVVVTLDDGQGGTFNFNATLDTNAKTWSAPISIGGLADRAYTTTVTATDLAGNFTPISAGQFTVDTTAPTVALDAGQLPTVVNADKTLTGTYDDVNIASVVVTLDDGQGDTFNFNATLDTNAKTWSAPIVISGLADSAYTTTVTATDLAGNSTPIFASQFTVDTTAPSVALDASQLPTVANVDRTLTGTYEDANIASVVVTLDNGQGSTFNFNSTLDTNAKTWSAPIAVGGLADGVYTTTVTATDLAGNSAQIAVGQFTVDMTAPTVALDAGQLPVAVNSDQTLTGTYDDANIAGVVVTLDNGQGSTFNFNATLDTNAKTWSAPIAVGGLADGVYTTTVTATDLAGNTTSISTGHFTVDTVPPTVALDSGQLPIVSNHNVTLSGTYNDTNIAGVTVTLDDGHGGTFNFNATLDTNAKTWSAPIAIGGLADGAYTTTVTATDLAGNSTPVSVGQFTVDTTVVLDSGQLPVVTNHDVTLTGTYDDANVVGIVMTLDDGQGSTFDFNATLDTGAQTWSAPIAIGGLADGAYTITVTPIFTAGNGTPISTGRFTVDVTPPSVTLDDGQLPAVVNANKTLTGTYDDAHIASVVVTLDDGHGGTFNFNATLDTNSTTWSAPIAIGGLADGAYTTTVTATDLAGNSTPISAGQFTVDTTAPSVALDAGQLPALVNADKMLTGTYDDANISGITVTLDDGNSGVFSFNATLNTNAKTWSATVSITGLNDGAYTTTVTATDLAGNSTPISAGQFTVDTIPPTVSIVDLITNINNPTLVGTVGTDAVSVSVTVAGVTYTSGSGDVVLTGFGGWSLTLPATSDGNYPISATATDAVGNSQTVGGHVLIDTQAPTVAFDNGQLPLSVKADTRLTGTFVEPNIASIFVTLDDGSGHTASFPATIGGDGAWSAPISIAGLPDGSYTVSVTATDLAANLTNLTAGGHLIIDTTAPTVVLGTTATNDSTPPLSGTIDDPTATIVVTVRGTSYQATNNGNGTWTLADNAIAALPDAAYRLTVTATDTVGNQGTTSAILIVNTAVPVIKVNPLVTTSSSPALSGTVNDPGADVAVTVNGVTYAAINNADGTWSLDAGAIATLAPGVYSVTATATNAFGTVGTDTTSNELTIGATQVITFSSTINKIIYVDADGTTVTVTASGGAVTLSFTGVNTLVTASGKTRTVTATGGVFKVDVDVPANTSKTTPSLTFTTNAAGDAQTTINQITGAGNLKSLTGKGVTLAGGVQMTGYIQTITVHAISSNIQMGTFNNGVTITADSISNSAIQTGVISKMTAKLGFTSSTVNATTLGTVTLGNVANALINAVIIKNTLSLSNVQNTSVNATTIGNVTMSNMQNTNLTAATIGAVTLTNVQFANAGTPFGVTASVKLKSLKIVEYGTTLNWKKQFLNSILDFSVLA